MTNLYYIAVLSIFLSPSLSLPSSQSYKIVIWFIWKTFHIWAVDSDHITRRTCEAHKWKFNVFVTMGQVFLFAFVAVCNFFCFVPITNEQILQKHFFPVLILRTDFIKKNSDMFGDYMFHMFKPRDVSIMVQSTETRTFFISIANFVECDDRSMMDWKMIVAKYLWTK